MKICVFCNAINDDNALNCKSCGSNSFKNKCNNCGTIFDKGVYCPNCGVKIGQQARVCPKCKTEYFSNACPTCGYVPESNLSPNNQGVTQTQPQRKTWLWVLGWIFIFPLPLMLILKKNPNIDNKVKKGIIIGAWVLYGILMVIGLVNNANKPKETKQYVYATEAVTEVPTAKPTEKPTVSETYPPTKAQENEQIDTDSEQEEDQEPVQTTPSINFYEYTDNVEAGSNAFVTIQGVPNTEYSIHVSYSSSESKADGLEKKVADDNGFVTWEWKVGPKTTPGEHSITVKGGGTSESVKFNVYN